MNRVERLAVGLGALALGVASACAQVYSESAASPTRVYADPPADRSPVDPGGAEGVALPLVRSLETLVWPLAADGIALLSSSYGVRVHPGSGDSRFHGGLDLRVPEGTAVYAAAEGVVSESGFSGAYGNVVIVDHPGGLQTLYAHHQRNIVRAGEPVRRGQPIALVGHTGNATGDHLHFEVRWKRGTVDPRTLLPRLSRTAAR